MIGLRNLSIRRGGKLLLSGVDVSLYAGWRVGVIGRNGCGKSSLFAAVSGELDPDAGSIDLPGKVRIASVAQETPSLPVPALDFVISGDVALHAALAAEAEASAREDWMAVAEAHQRIEALAGYDAEARAGRLLYGLGFPANTHRRAVAEFSGGWRVRLNLARALMTPSDMLLLDEPTNHLDLDAVLWLEQWLLRYPGMAMVISHDREFLDGIATHVLHLHEGSARLYTGDYTAFERQRAEHLRQQQIAFEKEQAERAHLQRFIDRFKAKASKARQAQSRVKRLAKLAGTEAVRAERDLHIAFTEPDKVPFSLLQLREVRAGYRADAHGPGPDETLPGEAETGGEHVVLDAVGFTLEAGDRVGLLGPNGAGKSTLVKTLVGVLPPLSGERSAHSEMRIGYFAQHTVESLQAGRSPIDHLRDLAPNASTQAMRNFLASWYFPGDRAFESVDGFSGGERARLALALIAWTRPNVLLLDEPTNHLDLDMREALAEALADFDGAIVLVSHDRHLIGLVCDRFVRVADGHVEPFDGDLDDYAAWLRARNARVGEGEGKPGKQPTAAPAPAVRVDDKQRRAQRNRLEKLEAQMSRLDAELGALESQLADPALYRSTDGAAARLHQQQSELAGQREAVEAEWMQLYTQLEAG